MNTSPDNYDAIESIIFNNKLAIQSVNADPFQNQLSVRLTTGLTLLMPLNRYRNLKGASAARLNRYELIANGTGIHWPELDEDLSLKGFLKECLQYIVLQPRGQFAL